MPLYINGEAANISLAQLVAEKRSDADFRNVTIYLRKDTNADVDEILWYRS